MSPASLPDPPFSHSRRIITEPVHFDDAVSGMSLLVDFQRRQERASRVEQFQTPNWALDFGEANVQTRVRGVLSGGWGSFCLSRGPGEATWNSQTSGTGAIALLPPGDEADGRTTASFTWLTAAIPPEMWHRSLAVAGVEPDQLQRLTVCRLPEPTLHSLERRLQGLQRELQTPGQPPEQLRAALGDTGAFVADCFTSLCEQAVLAESPRDSLRNRARLVRRAEAWMEAHLSESVQVPDLCLALRVSRRELEYAFRTIFDQSPRDYLQALRLNAIRRVLLQPSGPQGSIIEVAYAHGVTHLGRFAANYRALFGEKPSETVRR